MNHLSVRWPAWLQVAVGLVTAAALASCGGSPSGPTGSAAAPTPTETTTASAPTPNPVTASGTLLQEFDAFLRQSFQHRAVCSHRVGDDQDFVSGGCAPLSVYSPYFYTFGRGSSGTLTRVPEKFSSGAFGNYGVPMTVEGQAIACDPDRHRFLIRFADAASFSLACRQPQ